MPPKGKSCTAASAVASSPKKRGSVAAGNTGYQARSRRCVASSAASESQSSSSDDDSDPDEDVSEQDLITLDGRHVLDLETVRDACRVRVCDRTRTQYDQFIGIMVVFALSREEFKSLVVVKKNLSTFQPPLPITFVSEYFNHVENKRVPWLGREGKVKPVSPSYYKAVVLSIKDLYICEQIVMSDEMSVFIYSKRKKFQRDIQEMRAVGSYPSAPDRYMTSDGYRDLAKTVVEASPRDVGGWAVQAFAALWGYVVMLWCLMARCDRVARLRWADFGWYKDALTVYICKSKCDQYGVNAFAKKLYFNDACAEVCPITALAVIFFSREDESIRSDFVFPRSDTRRMGARYLSKIIECKYTPLDFNLFGCNPLGISWHFFKRGAFTFLAGLTDACSFVATKMRADQKVADVSRVYAFFGQGQDGVVGRLLSMLPYGEPEFIGCAPVISSVHASISWPDLVPDWDTLDERFKLLVVPRFFAVLVYRLDWLKQHLPADHPLWHSKVATSGSLLTLLPHVHMENLPLASLTGVTLEMKNSLRLSALAGLGQGMTPSVPSERTASLPLISKQQRLPPSERDDLGLRLLTPLPSNKRIVPHLTCQQAWRAWFLTTDSLPFPLRYAEGRLSLGSDVTALSRIKTVMNTLSQGIDGRDILLHSEATFQCAFVHLQKQLLEVDKNLMIFKHNTCGTIERKLRDAKVRGWCAAPAVFNLGVPPQQPVVYDAVEHQERQRIRRETLVRATNAFQCERCSSLCMHCMHCDTCVKRLNAAVAPAATAAVAPAVVRVEEEMAHDAADPVPPDSPAVRIFHSPTNGGVRCLCCSYEFYDKSGYNRHLVKNTNCRVHHQFEFVLRKSSGVRRIIPPPQQHDATGTVVRMYARTHNGDK
jgi:hypothetical protein